MASKPAPRPPEITLRGIALGCFITLLFTAANLYLGLKVGLTIATSIPAAVISMAVCVMLGRIRVGVMPAVPRARRTARKCSPRPTAA